MRFIVAFVVAFGAYACCARVSVAPGAVALDQAREEARMLLADGFRSLNAGRTTLLELAERVADMTAATTNSPARRRILQEGAFNMYREVDDLKRAAERRVPFWINLGTDAEFEFAACPAGSFQMGFEGDRSDVNFRHKVNITRPLWIARYQTTKRLYDTFRRVQWMSDEEKAYGGMDSPVGGIPRGTINAFCAFLTVRNKGRIPEGYVFRLPTDAEWEYALNANSEDLEDPYVRFKNGDRSVEAEKRLQTVPSVYSGPDDAEDWKIARHRIAVEHILTKTALSEQSRKIYRELLATGDNCAEVARRLNLPAATVRQVKSRVSRMIAAFEKTIG